MGERGHGGVAIEATDLTRRFGSHVALDGVDLRVEPGEAFGLLGANGAGKTTFIRLVTGYLVPTRGRVTVDGLSPVSAARSVNARVGFVAEAARLYPDLRVQSFLRFVAGARGLRGPNARAALERALTRFDLESVATRMVGNLSRGFQQRVSLAQAFLHEPALLIVDEPTSGLDPLQQAEVRRVLREVRGERTVVLCTHDLVEARELTTRVAVLHRGRVVALGPTNDVLGGAEPLRLFRGEPGAAA